MFLYRYHSFCVHFTQFRRSYKVIARFWKCTFMLAFIHRQLHLSISFLKYLLLFFCLICIFFFFLDLRQRHDHSGPERRPPTDDFPPERPADSSSGEALRAPHRHEQCRLSWVWSQWPDVDYKRGDFLRRATGLMEFLIPPSWRARKSSDEPLDASL